jgi:hypothetical protein
MCWRSAGVVVQVVEAEQTIKESLANVKGRGAGGLTAEQQEAIEDAVAILEQDCGILEPTLSHLLDGNSPGPNGTQATIGLACRDSLLGQPPFIFSKHPCI